MALNMPTMIELTCALCNVVFNREKRNLRDSLSMKPKYCSTKCAHVANKGNLNRTKDPRFPLSGKWPKDIQNTVHGRKKIWCIEYKGGKCQVCEYSRHPSALEFHHINPELKSFAISDSKNKIGLKILKQELDKCALLCANCHREVHAGLIDLSNE